jgi:amino-acid N-acetyltransferase
MRTIRGLVFSAMLDPTQLHWSQFWVIEEMPLVGERSPLNLPSPVVSDSNENSSIGRIVACGQLRSFPGAQELGSLVVAKQWRDRGLGSHLTYHLIQQASEPLYLECLGRRLPRFYQRFGFVPVLWRELPRSLKWKFAPSALGSGLLRIPITLMRYQEPANKTKSPDSSGIQGS